MPPATLDTNGPAVSLNLSPGMSVALTPTNSETAGKVHQLRPSLHERNPAKRDTGGGRQRHPHHDRSKGGGEGYS